MILKTFHTTSVECIDVLSQDAPYVCTQVKDLGACTSPDYYSQCRGTCGCGMYIVLCIYSEILLKEK